MKLNTNSTNTKRGNIWNSYQRLLFLYGNSHSQFVLVWGFFVCLIFGFSRRYYYLLWLSWNSLCRLGWPQTQTHTHPRLSLRKMLRSKACTTTPGPTTCFVKANYLLGIGIQTVHLSIQKNKHLNMPDLIGCHFITFSLLWMACSSGQRKKQWTFISSR